MVGSDDSEDLVLDQVEADIRLCEEFLARDNFSGTDEVSGDSSEKI